MTPADPLPAYPFAIRSRILDTEVWIIPAGWTEQVPGPAYTHAEVAILDRQTVTPDSLRAVHLVRVAIDGEIVDLPAYMLDP